MSNNNTTYSVYKIQNSITKKVYVGVTSVTLKRRMVQHMSDCKLSKHRSSEMVIDYLAHGRKSFSISLIVNKLSYEEALEIEKEYITKYDCVNNGYNNDADSIPTSFEWNGIHYTSITEASQKLGVGIGTIYNRIEKGYKCDEDIQHFNKRQPVKWNDVEYPSINAAAKACGISQQSMTKRLRNGYICDNDMKRPPNGD